MLHLFVVSVLGLLFAHFTDVSTRARDNLDGTFVYEHSKRISFFLCIFTLFIYAGLRIRGNDTGTYRSTYFYIRTGLEAVKQIDWSLGVNPGYILTAIILKTLGLSVQDYLMLYSAVIISINLWFIKKYSGNLTESIFLFIVMGCYTFTFAANKQCMATAIGLIGIDRYINKKRARFLFWIAIAALFHPYVLLFVVAPYLGFPTWSRRTYVIIVATVIGGLALKPLLGGLIYLTESIGETFDINSFNGAGVNVVRVIVCWIPVILSFLTRKRYWQSWEAFKENDKVNALFVNLAFMNAAIMFIGLFGTANYFARLANYFLVFQAISYPVIFSKFSSQTRKLLVVLSTFFYLIYFVYESNIVQGSFSSRYEFMSLFEYIKMHF